ncbi:hypothetical protein D9Q98_009775 [Chlorella vulgaris]|uniref:Uncharacterized protein n=1 Tax=Chlorella vulgaris TaxID=3077 RepID=A0A9D4TF28_CHLVU|nr:hypothetical protein D9Q98_009775 [Chlorella vulgaris]
MEDSAINLTDHGCADSWGPPASPLYPDHYAAPPPGLLPELRRLSPAPMPPPTKTSTKFKVKVPKLLAPTVKKDEPTAPTAAQRTKAPRAAKRAVAVKASRHGKARAATQPAKGPNKSAVDKPKTETKKRSSGKRPRIPGAKRGRRSGGLNIPREQLYLYHIDRLTDEEKELIYNEYTVDSNSVWKKVVGMLHEIRHQLTPAGHTLISVVITPQKKKPGSGIVTLTLDTQVLVAEGVLTWAAFKAAYMTPE